MKHYWNALTVEMLKLRRTLASWGILIGPTVIAILQYLILLDRAPGSFGEEYRAWEASLHNAMTLWALLMLPLYISLQTALLANLEHATGQWKYLYALPVPRMAYYAAKWTVMALVVAVTNLVLAADLVVGGWLMEVIRPGWGFNLPVPWEMLWQGWWRITIAATLLMTIHLLVSLAWRSFIPSLGLGLAAAIANIFVASSEKWSIYDPWMMPGIAYTGEAPANTVALWIGGGLGLVAAILGGLLLTWWQQRRVD
jgi:lantibiotic transport system permease protein